MTSARLTVLAAVGLCAAAGFAQVGPVIDLHTLTPDQGVVFTGEDHPTFLLERAVAGDINGDGKRDLIISAPFSSSTFGATVYVVFGGSDALTAGVVDLTTLGPPDGFLIRSPGGISYFGRSTTSGIDLNQDGIDDMVITGPCHSPDAAYCKGQAFIIYGHPGIGASGSFDVRTLDGTNGFVINGRAQFDVLGDNSGPIPVFDYNQDGYPDIVLVAPEADAPGRRDIGQTYIIFGHPGMGAAGFVEIADLDATNSITVNGLFAGSGVGLLGDVGDFNDDGVRDILWGGAIGPPDRPGAGNTLVLFGGTPGDENGIIESSTLPGHGGLVMYGSASDAHEYFPEPVGDVNGDGVVDHLINSGGGGYGCVVFGGSHLNNIDVIDLGDLDGTNGFCQTPCCRVYKAAGDLDGDGFTDIVRQDSFATVAGRTEAGRANVAFSFAGIGASGEFAFPLSPDGYDGFEIWGAEAWDNLIPTGWVPDINGDGLPELTLADQFYYPVERDRGYLVYGQRRFALGDFDRDHDVDARDFRDFTMCFNGSSRPPASQCPESVNADFDGDGDVDMADYVVFEQQYTGAR